MRIWFAASISPSAYGGVHRSMNQLASEMRRCGHFVDVIYGNARRRHHWLHFSSTLALRLLLLFWKRPHWIIARSSDGILSVLFCRIFKMKTNIALHSHGWEERVALIESRLPSGLITNPTTWRARLIGFYLLRLALKKSAICICGTIDEARWLRNRYPSVLPKITVIPNSIMPVGAPFWPSQPELPPSILMVGGFTWKKNLEYGIELFRRLFEMEKTARLFIVGCGPLSENKKRLLFTLGDAAFTVESEEAGKMARWYESCPILLFPSRYEGGRPFTILEAQSRGCVVFASDIGAVRECITTGINGFLLSGVNPVADVAMIRSVYCNHELMHRIGRSAWKKALRNSAQRQGQRLMRILQRETEGLFGR